MADGVDHAGRKAPALGQLGAEIGIGEAHLRPLADRALAVEEAGLALHLAQFLLHRHHHQRLADGMQEAGGECRLRVFAALAGEVAGADRGVQAVAPEQFAAE